MTTLSSTLSLSLLLLANLSACSSGRFDEAPEQLPTESDIWPPPLEEGEPAQEAEANPWLSASFGSGGKSAGSEESSPASGGSKATQGESDSPRSPDPIDEDSGVLEPSLVPPHARFERYKEGRGADKRLHLRQVGSAPAVDCRLEIYANGGEKVWRSLVLPSPWEPGVELVICTSTEAEASCNVELSGSGYNGNDALVLRCSQLVVDRFGRVGEDPGAAWVSPSSPDVTSKDAELLRCPASSATNETPFDVFLIGEQWVRLRAEEKMEEALQRCPARENLGGAAGGL